MEFPTYKLTDKQIRGIANIVQHEQGTLDGRKAEASLIANLTDIQGDKYATTERLIAKLTGGWFACGKTRYRDGYNGTVKIENTALEAVKSVLIEGKRTLPRYVNEHDCMSDISNVVNGSKSNKAGWVPHKTVIYNRMSSVYWFYDFPGGVKTGVDPFGYTSQEYRKKWGEFCYSDEKIADETPKSYSGTFPVVPDSSFGVSRTYYQKGDGIVTLKNYTTQIKRVQELLNWYLDANIEVDGKYGNDTEYLCKRAQQKLKLTVNGKFGKDSLKKLRSVKK